MRLWKCSPPDTYHTMDQEPSIFERNLLREEGGGGGGGGREDRNQCIPSLFPRYKRFAKTNI